MAKIESIKFDDFMSGDWKKPEINEDLVKITKIFVHSATIATVITPQLVFAADGGAFGNLHEAVMNGFDRGVVLVIIFAGASWGLGHRTKAIEILIGVCCGYLLARHAVDIRDFLKGI